MTEKQSTTNNTLAVLSSSSLLFSSPPHAHTCKKQNGCLLPPFLPPLFTRPPFPLWCCYRLAFVVILQSLVFFVLLLCSKHTRNWTPPLLQLSLFLPFLSIHSYYDFQHLLHQKRPLLLLLYLLFLFVLTSRTEKIPIAFLMSPLIHSTRQKK